MRGRFVTLEGTEGCGKSLQLRMLEQECRRRGLPFVATREPGGTAFGMEVRRVLLHRDGAPREPIAELLLYLADRYQHIQEMIKPTLESGRHVICDRYHDATLAYQAYARGIGFETVDKIAEELDLLTPDLTLVLEIDLEEGIRRARRRQEDAREEQWSRFEVEKMDFHRRVLEGYHKLRDREPERIVFVDASGTPEEVFARLWKRIEPLFQPADKPEDARA